MHLLEEESFSVQKALEVKIVALSNIHLTPIEPPLSTLRMVFQSASRQQDLLLSSIGSISPVNNHDKHDQYSANAASLSATAAGSNKLAPNKISM